MEKTVITKLIVKILGLTIDAISAGIRARRERKKREAEEQQAYQAAQKRAQQQAEEAARIRGAAEKETEHRP